MTRSVTGKADEEDPVVWNLGFRPFPRPERAACWCLRTHQYRERMVCMIRGHPSASDAWEIPSSEPSSAAWMREDVVQREVTKTCKRSCRTTHELCGQRGPIGIQADPPSGPSPQFPNCYLTPPGGLSYISHM